MEYHETNDAMVGAEVTDTGPLESLIQEIEGMDHRINAAIEKSARASNKLFGALPEDPQNSETKESPQGQIGGLQYMISKMDVAISNLHRSLDRLELL